MTEELDPLDFIKKYHLISSSQDYEGPGVKGNICRYCERTNHDVTFTQDTHLIPELLGENNLLTFDECDACNVLFSDFESHLSNFVRPHITMLGIKGKSKIPQFQSRSIDRKDETRTLFIYKDKANKKLILRNVDDYFIDRDNKTFDIVFRKPPFIPLKIYKALLKIGLSLLPKEYDKLNNKSFAWLTNRSDDIVFNGAAFITTLKRYYYDKPCAALYRAKEIFTHDKIYPEHTMLLCYANQVIQIFLPFSEEIGHSQIEEKNIDLITYPAFALDKIEGLQTFQLKIYDLSEPNSVIDDHKMSFSYEHAEFKTKDPEINNPPQTKD